MPRAPNKPCAFPGCPELIEHGKTHCYAHERAAQREYNRYKRDPNSNARYGRRWREIRQRFVSENPLCEECAKEGRLTPAEEVHHIIPMSHGGTHDWNNLMALCKSCHSRITAKDGGRWG